MTFLGNIVYLLLRSMICGQSTWTANDECSRKESCHISLLSNECTRRNDIKNVSFNNTSE